MATNANRLVTTRLRAQIQPASANTAVRPDGVFTTLPGQGGVVTGIQLGDVAGKWAGDHVEPGVSLGHPDPTANHAIRFLSCVGNTVTVLDGPAAGAAGMVFGKHGAVLATFAPDVVDRLAPGDGIAIAAQGIGLCRTEHMFFEGDRLGVMREMIFAHTAEDRRAVLDRLLPMQRGDFIALFQIMHGTPVCIRLFDPPLHEFLPADKSGHRELAEQLSLPLSEVTSRVEALTEYNPMLGMRGVRLGLTYPEIYDMQARAIFEATVEASRSGDPVVPEIMIPLVSAMREVELVKSRIDAVAAAVRAETGADFRFRYGVMVETPRAALRAEEIAMHAQFLSFGTNDLTQMTYGLSRDDAGRFMSAYVQAGVYAEDPFHTLDVEGVGELLSMGAERGRKGRDDVVLSICGEHGGSRSAISFCRSQKFDYVSCSPFRVPAARLSAAQLAISDRKISASV